MYWRDRALLAEQALDDIIDPLSALKRYAEEQGREINPGLARQFVNDPHHLRQIARKARGK